MAEAYGLDFIVVGPLPGSTTTAAATLGIPAVLGEVGGQGLWPEEDVALQRPASPRARTAGLITDAPGSPADPRGGWDGRLAPGGRVGLLDAGDRRSANASRPASALGEVQDPFGRTLQFVEAPIGGTVLFIVTTLAMNAGDPLLAIAD